MMENEVDARIKVVINKQEEYLNNQTTTIMEVLENRNAKRRTAVWVNGKQLLKTEYSTTMVMDGDYIKILRIVAGG